MKRRLGLSTSKLVDKANTLSEMDLANTLAGVKDTLHQYTYTYGIKLEHVFDTDHMYLHYRRFLCRTTVERSRKYHVNGKNNMTEKYGSIGIICTSFVREKSPLGIGGVL